MNKIEAAAYNLAELLLSFFLCPCLLRKHASGAIPKTIAYLEIDRLGDLTLAAPALTRLRLLFPHAKIILIASSKFIDILRDHPAIDEFIELDAPWTENLLKYHPLRYIPLLKRVLEIRKNAPDAIVESRGDLRRHVLMMLIGSPVRVSFNQLVGGRSLGYHGRLLTLSITPPNLRLHRADENLFLVDAWVRSMSMPFSPSPITQNSPRTRKPFNPDQTINIGLNIESNWPNKVWPQEEWRALLIELAKRYRANFFIFSEKQAGVNDFVELIRPCGIHLQPVCVPLKKLKGELSKMNLYISSDSGPMHVADDAGCTVISLFGPSDIQQWHPYRNGIQAVVHNQSACEYAPCRVPVCKIIDCRCIRIITPDMILQKIEVLLK